MKAKLTVSIDEDLIPRAKEFARARGVSLSRVIEDALRAATSGEEETFSARWRGRFKPRQADDPIYQALARKYL